jgi:hypothetical protein
MSGLADELRQDAEDAESGEYPEDACRWAITMRNAADHIEALEKELSDLKDGRTAVMPKTREHAQALLSIATTFWEGNANIEGFKNAPEQLP